MHLQKPIWLVLVLVIALACVEIIFTPVKFVFGKGSKVPDVIRFEVEKNLLAGAESQEVVQGEILASLKDKIQFIQRVDIIPPRTISIHVITDVQEEYDQWKEIAQQELSGKFGKVRFIPEVQGEQPTARVGFLAFYFPLRPHIKLGLDLRGGTRLVLRALPTTVYTFSAKQKFYTNDEDRAKLVELLVAALNQEGYKEVEVSIPPDVNKLEVVVDTTTKEDITKARNLLEGMLSGRFEGLKLDDTSPTKLSDVMDEVIAVVDRRVNDLGVEEAAVQQEGLDRVVISVPGVDNPAYLIDVLRKFAKLEFRVIPKEYYVGAQGGVEFYDKKTNEQVDEKQVLSASTYILGGRDLVPGRAQATTDLSGLPIVTFVVKSTKSKDFYKGTREFQGFNMAIVLDGKAVSAPTIQTPISDNGEINGLPSNEYARTLATWLRAGALPVPLEVQESRSVSSTVGDDTVRNSLVAGALGVLAVIVFMIGFYRLCGVLADLALLVYGLIVLAIVVAIPVTLTLPGIAGFLLSLGMAVDANVIIFERLREELKTQKGVKGAVEAGFRRAWAAILDCNVTTILACIVLYFLGTGGVKGFALTLGIGIICSVFTAVVVTRIFINFAARSERLVQSPLFVKP